jgi:hypothetical protein
VFKPTLYLATFAGWGLDLDLAAAGANGWSGDFMFEDPGMKTRQEVWTSRSESGERLTLLSP